MSEQMAGPALDTAVDPPRRYVNPIPEEGDNGVYSQSWFVLCMSTELLADVPKRCDFLGGKVVAYRDASGQAHCVSAYCPHLGADLACGKVLGNHLQCAFHHWEFAPTGRCVRTAIGEKPPPHARLFVFPVKEKYGLVWAFNGHAPLWDLPNFNAPHDDESRLIWDVQRRDPPFMCSPWVFCCNTLDFQHSIAVHGVTLSEEMISGLHKRVRWNEFGFDYDREAAHQGGIPISWQLGIRGTSFFWQQGTYDGFWFGFVTGFSLPRAGINDVYLAVAVEADSTSADDQALARRRLEIAMALEVRTIEEDRPIVSHARFAPGHLIRADRSMAQFFDYLRRYPRQHPSKPFIQ